MKKLNSKIVSLRKILKTPTACTCFRFAFLFLLALSFQPKTSQAQQVLEFTAGDNNPVSTDLGPIYETTIRFINNIDNPTGNLFESYLPQSTAKISLLNFNPSYTHAQDVLNTETIEPLVIGWNFDDSPVYETEGVSNDFFKTLNFLPDSENQLYTSVSSSNAGEGIDASSNKGVLFSTGLQALSSESVNGRYRIADLEIEFNRPQSNPVLHLTGMGAYWSVEFEDGSVCLDDPLPELGDTCDESFTVDNEENFFTNTSSVEFTLKSIEAASFNGLSKLSGTDVFEINGSASVVNENEILNSATDPDDLTPGVAHGSVEVLGTEITKIIFEVFVQGRSNSDPCGLGWGGGQGWVFKNTDGTCSPHQIRKGNFIEESYNTGEENEPLVFNFANDAWMLSISSQVQPDEVELAEGEGFRMLSSPVTSTSYRELLGDLWIQGGSEANGYDTNSGDPNIFTWSKGTAETGDVDFGWQEISDLGSEIPAGEGFLMTVFGDDDFDGNVEGFPKTLSVTGSEPAPPIIVNDGGGVENGWILAGNPFNDPILVDELLTNRITNNLNEVVYIWDRGLGAFNNASREPGWRYGILAGGTAPAGDGAAENPILGSLGQGIIMPFQGFFIERNSDSGNGIITFDNETTLIRADLADPDGTGTFFRKDIGIENVLALEINGENLYNDLWFRFDENGSFDRLRNDALELASYNEHYATFSTNKTDGDLLTFSNLPTPSEETEIPVHFETTKSGTYTIQATEANLTFPYNLYFTDLYSEESIRIDQDFSYTFTVNQAAKPNPVNFTLKGPQKAKTVAASDRFLITTQPREFKSELPSEVALNQNYPNPFNHSTQITCQLPQQSDVQLQVYDMTGRHAATLVNENVNAGTHTVNFNASELSSGVYLHKLQAGATVHTRKLTLIK